MGTFQDLTGQQFGRWTVVNYVKSSGWLCECSCENHTRKIVKTSSLKKGLSKSCGCLRKEVNSADRLTDLAGMTFGEWKVIEYKGSSQWLCECSCTTRKVVKAQVLKSGKSTSCGHNTTGFKDLTGQAFGYWKVLEYRGNGRWLCTCTRCNKTKEVLRYNLINGCSTSCGCTKGLHKIIDLTGKRFGELTVQKYIGGNKWLSRCSCGNMSINYSHNLRKSDTISCGCKEAKPYTKEEILNKISEYKKENGELPFTEDLCDLLDRAITSVRRYIHKYDLYYYINHNFRSKPERGICELFPTTSRNVRNIVNGYELDLYYPERKIAIEFNGSYWHSELYKDKYYHQQKTAACARQGIRVIHIFEYEWDDLEKREKIINILSNTLGINKKERVYARKTTIQKISNDEAMSFLDKYHLQNSTSSTINLGCFYKDELIGVITFGKPRFNNNYEYEIHRLCWKNEVQVVGGTEKLFKYFLKNYNPQSIITYADISKFTGDVYTKIGFRIIKPNPITEPNYVWWKSYGNVVMSRYQTQKHKLLEMGLGTEDQTENEIMTNNGFVKIYDAGNLKLEWTAE